MKLDVPEVVLEKSADFEKHNFGIRKEDMGIILSILRSKLYSNPIKSAVQEYASNARDAHREIGKDDVPIEITIPSKMDSAFKVRDFGPGITPERMVQVFINYGSSTKRSSDKLTGGFGIGAKSGFALTDNFSITSITPEDGKMIKRQYIAVIDESNVGEINLVSEEPTDEAQGTEISIPVKYEDRAEFDKYAHKCSKYWNPKPKIFGSFHTVEAISEPCFSGVLNNNKYELIKRDSYYSDENLEVILDGIPYPIKRSAIKLLEHPVFKNYDWRLYFGCGELQVNANRDDLEYNQFTIKVLNELLTEGKDKFIESLSTSIGACETLWDAHMKLKELHNTHNKIVDKGVWQGIEFDLENIKIHAEVWHCSEGKKPYQSDALIFTNSTVLCINDEVTPSGKPSRGRIATLLEDYNHVQIINRWHEWKPDVTIDASLQTPRDYKAESYASEHLDKYTFVMLSTIPKQKQERSERGKAKVFLSKLEAQGSSRWNYSWQESTVDLKTGTGVYVETFRKDFYINGETYSDVSTLRNILEHLGINEVYAIPQRMKDKIDSTRWTNISAKIDEKFTQLLNGKNKLVDTVLYSFSSEFRGFREIITPEFIARITNKNGLAYHYISNDKTINEDLNYLARYTTVQVKTSSLNFKKLKEKFIKKYPLFETMNAGYLDLSKEAIDDLVKYINMKDAE